MPVLAFGGLAFHAVMAFVTAFLITAWFGNRLPVFGFNQSPDQPIAFPHTFHAGVGILIDQKTGKTYKDIYGNERVNDSAEDVPYAKC